MYYIHHHIADNICYHLSFFMPWFYNPHDCGENVVSLFYYLHDHLHNIVLSGILSEYSEDVSH